MGPQTAGSEGGEGWGHRWLGLWEEMTGAETPGSEGGGAWGSRLLGLSLLGEQALCCELKCPPHHPP